MKKVAIGFLLAFSFSALAFFPEDGDSLEQIGAGTQIEFLRDISIKPNTESYSLGSDQKGRCLIEIKPSAYDRVIKKGRNFSVREVETFGNLVSIYLNGIMLQCVSKTNGYGGYENITFGGFKVMTKDIFKFSYPGAIEI